LSSFNSAAQAKAFCEDVNRCPDASIDVDASSCCIHHANIHVCDPSVSVLATMVVCHITGIISFRLISVDLGFDQGIEFPHTL